MPTQLLAPLINLVEYESNSVVPIRFFGPGTYIQPLSIQGNSLLSSLFVQSIDLGASVQINYYDYGIGGDVTPVSERYNLASHTLITSATIPRPDRILVTRAHDKPVIEIIVTGGTARLGIYVTVVSSFASDLDSALVKDEQIADLSVNKGIPVITYDENNGKFFILRTINGVVPVAFSEAGDAVHLSVTTISTPGVEQILIDDTVPSGKTRKATQVFVVSRTHGSFTVESDGAIIGSGRTGPASPMASFSWNPRRDIAEGLDVKVKFTGSSLSPANDVEAYFMGSDV